MNRVILDVKRQVEKIQRQNRLKKVFNSGTNGPILIGLAGSITDAMADANVSSIAFKSGKQSSDILVTG